MNLGPLGDLILAKVPISVSGYASSPLMEGQPEGITRTYSLGTHIIAEVQVMYYEGRLGKGRAGFLFDEKLYLELNDVDEAVCALAAKLLLDRWKE
jgi:hypothetical protein